MAIRFVCRAIGTDVAATSDLLRQGIEPDHLAQYGSEELRLLADGVPSIVPHQPGLVRDIYGAAFGHQETSDAPTPFLEGSVLPLTSNRRQDYQGGLRQLTQAYSEFLRAAPQEAVEAMNAALEWHATHKRWFPEEEAAEFDLDGERALLLTDNSRIWDGEQRYPDEDPIELLDQVEHQLENLAGGKGGTAQLADLLDTVVRTCRLAAVWRRLLRLGARYPDQIGMRIRAAGWSLPVLMCPDTTTDVGNMNSALFLDLSKAERERVERAILPFRG